ncbi:MAG: HEAT repeat domain-containing protein [Kiritimatiellia bacterium]|jgi:HEAT repeat protein|nr:HEAT repeat domain-containing protein [Kiritimatiellia bacterium]
MKIKSTLNHPLILAALLFSTALASFPTGQALADDDDLINMIVELVKGSDGDMRALALQQIREEIPGEAATTRFVELLPTLPPDLQVEVLDALGERGDAVARPGVLKMLNSKTDAVRAMAARALSGLATPADIPVLAKVAATGSDAEKESARHSLRRLPGNEMNVAMTGALKKADAKTRIELISALIDRDAKESVPAVLESAADSDLEVRLAVLAALRAMADENHVATVVKCLKASKDKSEHKQAELALLATCSRGRAKCADAVVAGFEGADVAARISMVRSLAEAGGPEALGEIVARVKDEDAGVSSEAVRVLAGWTGPAAIPHLKKMAGDVKNLRNHVLAIRGIVRLAAPGKDKPADLATLAETMKLASRKEEKILVIGALGTVPTEEALKLVAAAMDKPELLEDAGFAAVNIAEKITDGSKAEIKVVMTKVADSIKHERTRERAKKVLESL